MRPNVVPKAYVDVTPLPVKGKGATAKTEVAGSTSDTIVSPVGILTEAFANVAVYCTASSGWPKLPVATKAPVQSALSKYSSLVVTEKVVPLVAVAVLVNCIWLSQSCRHTPSYFASSALAGDTVEEDDAEDDTAEDGEAEPPPPHAANIVELSNTARYFM